MTNDSIVKIIEKWKHFWMNQTQNSEEDRQNYFNRAFGVDANMKYHLVDKIWSEVGPLVEELDSKRKDGHMMVEHGYRMAAEHKVKELEARVTELIRWHEKKDHHVQKLESFVIGVAPSWLPENFRNERRSIIKSIGMDKVVE